MDSYFSKQECIKAEINHLKQMFSGYSLNVYEENCYGRASYGFSVVVAGRTVRKNFPIQGERYSVTGVIQHLARAIQSAIDAENDDWEVQDAINSNSLPEESIEDPIEDEYDLDISNLLVSEVIPLSTEY